MTTTPLLVEDDARIRIRRKIEHDPANPSHIVTVRGVGCRADDTTTGSEGEP